jgi:hypothetical protein
MIGIVWLFIRKAGPVIIAEGVKYVIEKSIQVIKNRQKKP